ncbi:hypothetical protein [Sphingobacterium sp. BN32]|uniref:hypothetical protein n=1 Tax=Sphingobacterium sp. BN32 TaxID=3058432 RepID=UPI00265D2DD2|nr:hypothetical protein [Sphingobacterium sp. BN32]WKK59778.1 hypothetical protein QYC40_05950 [Sphingobacterium sp. BN32]
MKKLLSMAVFMAGLTGLTYAQSTNTEVENKDPKTKEVRQERNGRMHMKRHGDMMNKTPEQIAQAKTDRLDKELKFSDKQKKDVYAYHLSQAQEWKAKAEARKAERQARMNEMKADRQAFENLLTPEQKEIYKNKLAERKQRFDKAPRKEQRKGGKGNFKPVETTDQSTDKV